MNYALKKKHMLSVYQWVEINLELTSRIKLFFSIKVKHLLLINYVLYIYLCFIIVYFLLQ